MEAAVATPGTVTTGLLTVELKTGNMQTGDTTFVQRSPAVVAIAGDPGAVGPTYADLTQLAEHVPVADGPTAFRYHDGVFAPISRTAAIPSGFPPLAGTYTTDPGGRYGQFRYPPFAQFIAALPLPIDQTTGFPISPLVFASVPIGGVQTMVAVQAFERRVLTYNPSHPDAFKVEFGNIGQHYFRWRSGAPSASATPTRIASAGAAPAATPTTAASAPPAATPSSTASAVAPSVPTVSPPPSPAPGTPTPTIVGPGARYDLTVAVTESTPAFNGRVTVVATLTADGQPVGGAMMRAIWDSGGSTQSCTSPANDAGSTLRCSGDVGAAARGVLVRVDVFVIYQGLTFGKSTSFTPQ